MKTLFNLADTQEIQHRLAQLTPQSERAWGTMNAAQMMAHCTAGLAMATGEIRPARVFIGRIIGPMIKGKVLRDEAQMRKNSPTARELIVRGDRYFEAERKRLAGLIDSFHADGPAACTTHPHPFFGRLTSEQWGVLMYKHLDHHLRQFGA